MALPKGRTNNPNGRPSGSGNRVSAKIKQDLSDYWGVNLPRVLTWVDGLEGKELFDAFLALMPYFVAREKEAETGGETNETLREARRIAMEKVYARN